ncbi:hypothetical protein CDD82_1276 [Ophiocordyceps australis]|uniref:YAG7-like dimerisation domain-containing protein n=1 Tax=Ophiocordyceps australis TaxID=1399860 RepID=A0A2C5YKS7_9HYPO|nr:hypothetical protein CDD82_1276 [Ophiocordyceps australis]
MAASTAQAASRPSKKKASKAIDRSGSPSISTTSAQDKTVDTNDENPYVRDLQKNIRNLNKKLAHASKTDSILSQHKDKTLDQLVSEKVINADQKAQVLKKPSLQAQLTLFEDQLAQHQSIHEQYRARTAADKAEWEQMLERAKIEAANEAKEEFKKTMYQHLLTLSQFLRLAAYRREEAKDPESDESRAIEGVLLAIYTGDDNAVASMLKLIESSDEPILSVPGEQLRTTYANVKAFTQEYKTPYYAEGVQASEPEPMTEVITDPTVAHAAATELNAPELNATELNTSITSNGTGLESSTNGIQNISVSDEAANAVAESHWVGESDVAISQEWVDVKTPRDAAETETGIEATPAAPSNTQSWADEQPDAITLPTPVITESNDGFHQVQRNRGRTEREGGAWRGRGRGEWRSRGRGEGRGRGRGRGNGGTAPRGRRSDES